MKAHFTTDAPDDVVALYPLGGAYVGTSPVGPRTLNVCFLARRAAFDAAGRSPERLLERASNERWRAQRERLERVGPWVSVAAMSFRSRRPTGGPHLLVGDAAALVSPFLGQGLSMALESGRLAAAALDEPRAGAERVEVAARYAAAWRRRFRGRLFVGEWAQRVLLSRTVGDVAVRALAHVPGLVDALVERTRSGELVADADELSARPVVEVRG
jgi:flavin-dependent dehydrogenase